MDDEPSVYEELGVPRVVNAAGTKTRIGGSRIRPEAVEAMSRAAESFVRISDLQARASELIAEVTNAEAGYVASGAAAAMTLGTAACIAGDDVAAMSALPETGDRPHEVVMPRTHRTGYDHAIRAAGATIVDVGTNDPYLGTGASSVEPWAIESAIGEDTAAVAYVQKEYTEPPLGDVIEIARRHDVPVLVDAAAELPPAENLSRFVDAGADLVVFSGGKAIRGPQSTGILAGRADLIESAALQHLDMHATASTWEPPEELVSVDDLNGVPQQGIGRGLKVGKEELVGLIRALELFSEEDADAKQAEWADRLDLLQSGLADVDGIALERSDADAVDVAPTLRVAVDAAATGTDAVELARELKRETPRVFVGEDAVEEGQFVLNPMCLTDEEAEYVRERLRAHLT